MRDFYFVSNESFTAFSSRPDFFNNVDFNADPDIVELSSYWLLSVPLSHKSLFRNIKRLGPGGYAKLKNNKPEVRNVLWLPDEDENSNNAAFLETLNKITTFSLDEGNKLSLGLSGGLDSRVLLRTLLDKNKNNWQVHTFSLRSHPDRIIAEHIASDTGINSLFLDYENYSLHEHIKKLKDYIGVTSFLTSLQDSLLFPFYKKISDLGFVIIDGGLGEIHRGEFFTRLLYFNKEVICKKHEEKLISSLKYNKGDIFNKEVTDILNNSLFQKVDEMFNEMPEAKEFGIKNWLNLLILRYKFYNISGLNQIILDNISTSYMPFVQKDLLNISFNLKVGERKNGRLYRDFLADNKYKLQNYPLIKNNIKYSFKSSTLLTRAILAVKRKTGKYFKDNTQEKILELMKDYVFDITNSTAFNSFDYYDHKKIKNKVDEFYKGNSSLAGELNNWLTFDIWRSIFFEKR